MTLSVAPYPTLALAAFVTSFPAPVASLDADEIADRLQLGAEAPVSRDDHVKAAVRDLLRHRGYKPTGRGKPASEYLVGAAAAERLAPINAAVDACNVVSLHSGLPISVVDLDRATAPFRVDVPADGAEYVFNASGQTIRLTGLPCLFDAEGPCANAVRDAQHTKTRPETVRTLSVVWSPDTLAAQRDAAVAWYRRLLGELGATTEPVVVQ